MFKNKKGQSTVEYIILVTAVIAVIIFFLVSPNSPFQRTLNETYNRAMADMTNMSTKLGTSHQ